MARRSCRGRRRGAARRGDARDGARFSRASQPDAATLALDELEIRQAITIDKDRARHLRVRLNSERGITIDSQPRLTEESYALHALARIAPATAARPPLLEQVPCRERIDSATVYARARSLGLDYGPQFRVVSHVDVIGDDAAHAQFMLPADSMAVSGYLLPPPLLDGGLQAFLALLGADIEGQSEFSLLPWRFTGVKLFAPFGRLPSQARLAVTGRGARSARGTIAFYDRAGDAVAEIAECWFRRVRLSLRQSDADRTFHFTAAAMPRPEGDAAPPIETSALIDALPIEWAKAGETALLLEGFIASAAHKALIGRFPTGAPFAVDDLMSRGEIAADAAPLLTNLLHRLAGHGAAVEEAGLGWGLAGAGVLPDPSLIWRTVLTEGPVLTAELALAAAAAETLPGFLANGAAPALPPSLVEQFYYASPSGGRVVDVLTQAVVTLAAQCPWAGRCAFSRSAPGRAWCLGAFSMRWRGGTVRFAMWRPIRMAIRRAALPGAFKASWAHRPWLGILAPAMLRLRASVSMSSCPPTP